jgi:hypothetical protein
MNVYTFSNSTKQLKSKTSSYRWAHLFDVGPFIIVAWGVRGGVIGWNLLHACRRRRSHEVCQRSWSHQAWRRRSGVADHPHLHWVDQWSLLLARGRRSGAAAARASHLLHTCGRRSGAAAARASHLMVQGRRRGAAQGRSKPPVAVSGLPLRELRMLAKHGWPNVTKNSNMHYW